MSCASHRTPSSRSSSLQLATWLGQCLTRQRAIDPTQASYTGLMASTDGSCRWLDDVLHRLGIRLAQLRRRLLAERIAPLLATAETLGLPVGIPGTGRVR